MVTDYASSLPIRNDVNSGYDELNIKNKVGTEIDVKSATGSAGVLVLEKNATGVKVDLVTDSIGLATEATLAAIQTAIEILDDWDESDRAKVNVNWNSGQSVTLNAGTSDAGTLRVVNATDDVNLVAIKTALEIMDDWDDGSDRAKVSIDADNVGLATEVTLASVKTAVESIDTKFPNQGVATSSGSIPVVIASDQSPINVNVVAETPPDPVHEYHEHTAIAINTNDTWTYTNTTGKTIHLEQVFMSASGEGKLTLEVGVAASETTRVVAYTSKSTLIANVPFEEPIAVLNGQNIKITVRNTDKGSMDLHTFFSGYAE